MSTTVSELVSLRWLLVKLGFPMFSATPLYCDNQAALHILANRGFYEQNKHVEMDCYFVQERVLANHIAPRKIATTHQPADIFTKGINIA
ncbi:unnamed protein product [Linum trigynum]|uniref:Uncharacterized protein n=1 Tax=Linum trigynum TaxID=586398 RepID=A0AAV2GRQ9_9ROSI